MKRIFNINLKNININSKNIHQTITENKSTILKGTLYMIPPTLGAYTYFKANAPSIAPGPKEVILTKTYEKTTTTSTSAFGSTTKTVEVTRECTHNKFSVFESFVDFPVFVYLNTIGSTLFLAGALLYVFFYVTNFNIAK